MRKAAAIIPLFLLGCGTFAAPRDGRTVTAYMFDPMTPADRSTEWERCQHIATCAGWERLIGAPPPDIALAAANGRRNCLQHAEEARRQLGRGEVYRMCSSVGPHAVLIVDGLVIDNGALAGVSVFPVRDLAHYEMPCGP